MWSYPQHNLTSVSHTFLSHSPASSSLYCLTILVLYYTTFSFSLSTCVLALFLDLCLSIAFLLVSHVSCFPSPLPFCLYFSLLPNHSLPQYVYIVTYSFKVLGQSLIVVQCKAPMGFAAQHERSGCSKSSGVSHHLNNSNLVWVSVF